MDCQTQRIDEFSPDAKTDIETDQYGQQVLVFNVDLAPGETRSFGYTCLAAFFPHVQTIDRGKVGSLAEIPANIKQLYCQNVQRIYDLENPTIKSLGAQFLSQYPNLVDRVFAVHSYVSSNIKYRAEDGWDSAPQVLARRSGSCSEFSYVFSALLRSTGIPTRFAAGSRMRGQIPYIDKEGHRWCEVYLPGLGWTPFDPTLDSKNPSKPRYRGTFFMPSLITTHGGGASNLLQNGYNGISDHRDTVSRERTFTWLD
jgi:transglutaminase-like putative cysteine protease